METKARSSRSRICNQHKVPQNLTLYLSHMIPNVAHLAYLLKTICLPEVFLSRFIISIKKKKEEKSD